MQRLFIEKKKELDTERLELLNEFKNYLGIKGIKDLRVIDVYDLIGGSLEDTNTIINEIIAEPIIENLSRNFKLEDFEEGFRFKNLRGQFNKREYFTNKIIKTIFPSEDIRIESSKIIAIEGASKKELKIIKNYQINPIETKELPIDDFSSIHIDPNDEGIIFVDGFIDFTRDEVEEFKIKNSIGMDMEDLIFVKKYFEKESRDPSITEIKLIDTYWSDHCRHTTFNTKIGDIEIEEGKYRELFQREIENYLQSRDYTYEKGEKPISLMDLATINMKELRKKGLLEDKEDTDEINAASIEIDVDIDGKDEKWLLMFKNETHNHPTEMEPFGGAATCLGGAIRDPLSGRAYVYQAMRITGAADPRRAFKNTLKGKLSQRKITRTAMKGYSSYGNEIGASTGFVKEIYDPGFLAKRLECGALVAAAPKENVYRGVAKAGDLIVLVGGRTGRDGLGGAVGSSKEHSEDSLDRGGSEVQKGNPSLERKIMRLFRKPHLSKIIKVCNDFGAGGVGVAIGELADGIVCELDKVPLKYEGLSPTEITLSESQERMACLIDEKDKDKFLQEAKKEDLEATIVARVTEEKTLKFTYENKTVVDIKREFLDTNGVEKNIDIKLANPEEYNPFYMEDKKEDLEARVLNLFGDINIGSQKGLVENFDNTVSGETVLMPYGGEFMMSPSEGMVSKIPVLEGETSTSSIMTFGYDPDISKWSPYHGGYYATIESIAKVVALGGSYKEIRFSFQEYFERLGNNKIKWGKPFLSLLGAFSIQKALDIASIGGKDSMSGTFEDIDVPPTLISFAVTTEKIQNIISSEFKEKRSKIVLIELEQDEDKLIDLNQMMEKYDTIYELNKKAFILSASSVKRGGIIRSIVEMSFGNKIGFKCKDLDIDELFKSKYGSIVLELKEDTPISLLGDFTLLGRTTDKEEIAVDSTVMNIDNLIKQWESVQEDVFPVLKGHIEEESIENSIKIKSESKDINSEEKTTKPKVLIPIFTGTHGEYTLEKRFKEAGGDVDTFVFKLSTKEDYEDSLLEFKEKIEESNIIALAHGMVFSNEPSGGGKLLKNILQETIVKEALDGFISNTDGLILGIGDGFQALLKAGIIGSKKAVLSSNKEGGYISTFAHIKVVDDSSPWFSEMTKGDVYSSPIGTYEGRLVFDEELNSKDIQIATRFVGKNPTGSIDNIESLTSIKGRVLGTTTSIDRMSKGLYKNIDIKEINKIIQSGVNYFNR